MVAKNRKQFEVKLGKTGVSLLVMGMVTGLFATFLFGVKVGKNIDTYPAMVSGYLPDRIGERLGWKKPAPAVVAEAKKDTPSPEERDLDLTFYDTLTKGKDGDLILRRPAASTPTAPSAAPADRPAVPQGPPIQAPAVPAVKPAVKAPAAGVMQPSPAVKPPLQAQARDVPIPPSPAASKPAAPVPGAVKPAPGATEVPGNAARPKGKYGVQLVSYRERDKAEQLSKKLADLGYHPHIAPVEVPGKGTWYRVQLTGFGDADQARKASAAVSEKVPGVKGVVMQTK